MHSTGDGNNCVTSTLWTACGTYYTIVLDVVTEKSQCSHQTAIHHFCNNSTIPYVFYLNINLYTIRMCSLFTFWSLFVIIYTGNAFHKTITPLSVSYYIQDTIIQAQGVLPISFLFDYWLITSASYTPLPVHIIQCEHKTASLYR